MYGLGVCKCKCFLFSVELSYFSNSIDNWTVAIKNIRNMHAVSTSQIADILQFDDKVVYYLRKYIVQSFSNHHICTCFIITSPLIT